MKPHDVYTNEHDCQSYTGSLFYVPVPNVRLWNRRTKW